MLKWDVDVTVWPGQSDIRWKPMGYCEHGNEPSGSMNSEECLNQLTDSHCSSNGMGPLIYFSSFTVHPSIIRMIKTMRMRWVVHVAQMEEEECI
jgi:hypothetical protein